jgi:hypothetical protein
MASKMEMAKAKAAAAGKMQQDKKSAMADKMKAAPKPMAKPAMPARPAMADKMKVSAVPRPMARQPLGPNASFADAKAAAMRNGVVSPNAAKMVGKTFGGMGMKKGGKAKKK